VKLSCESVQTQTVRETVTERSPANGERDVSRTIA